MDDIEGTCIPNRISWDKITIDTEKLCYASVSDYFGPKYDSKWVERWFERAKQVSTWSKDPSTKIGAVFINEEKHRELSAGYNGFPRGIKDDDRLNNRELKYKMIVHAEMNAIFNAVNNGVSLEGSSLFVWGLPICSECAKGIIQVGVAKIYVKEEFVNVERWKEAWELSQNLFKEVGIKVIVT